MLTIRLQRRGRKNDPSFRVLVLDSKRGPKSGSYLDLVGSYDPRVDRIELNAERIKHWLSMGATTSGTVHNLLVTQGIIDAKKRNVLPKKTVPKKDLPAEAGEPKAEVPKADEPSPAATEEVPTAEEAPVPREEAPASEVAVEEVAAEASSETPSEAPASEEASA